MIDGRFSCAFFTHLFFSFLPRFLFRQSQVDLFTRADFLDGVKRECVEELGFEGEIRIAPTNPGEVGLANRNDLSVLMRSHVSVKKSSPTLVRPCNPPNAQGLPDAIYDCSLLVCATNVPNVVDVDLLPPGCIVVDDSFPHAFETPKGKSARVVVICLLLVSARLLVHRYPSPFHCLTLLSPSLPRTTHFDIIAAIERFEAKRDIIFSEAGTIHAPHPMARTCFVPPSMRDNPALLAECAGAHVARVAFGCWLFSFLVAGHELFFLFFPLCPSWQPTVPPIWHCAATRRTSWDACSRRFFLLRFAALVFGWS